MYTWFCREKGQVRGRSDVIILFLFNNYVVVKILIFIYLYFKLDEYFMKKRREMERESVGCTAGPSSMIRLRKRKTTVRRGRGGTAWAPAMMIWWRTEVGPTCLLVFPSVAHRDLIKIKGKLESQFTISTSLLSGLHVGPLNLSPTPSVSFFLF